VRRAGNVEGKAGQVRTKQDRTVKPVDTNNKPVKIKQPKEEGTKGKIGISSVEILLFLRTKHLLEL
jgi:hypothetical protein